jgi:hypothetical protein
MKKVFQFNVPNKKPDRQIEAVRYEINKYLARERRKPRPEGVDFWDFNCRIGDSEQSATPVKVLDIKNAISQIVADGKSSFYMEILAKPGRKTATKD